MKYEKPEAEKLDFEYDENITASIKNGDVGMGKGKGGGCDHVPYHGANHNPGHGCKRDG